MLKNMRTWFKRIDRAVNEGIEYFCPECQSVLPAVDNDGHNVLNKICRKKSKHANGQREISMKLRIVNMG